MAFGVKGGVGLVRVRYRQADGQFVDTTLDRLVVGEVADGLPVREFRWYKGRRHYSGWYWSSSTTTRRLVAYESRLEAARIMLADFDPGVVSITAQPFQLIGLDGSVMRRHVPDALLTDADSGVTVVDVKAPSKMADPGVQAVFGWTRQVVASRGWAFEAWSGASRGVLENIRFLAGYRRRSLVDEALLPVVEEAAQQQSTIGAIERALSDRHGVPLVRAAMLHLLWIGVLRTDLDRPLSVETPVRVGREAPR